MTHPSVAGFFLWAVNVTCTCACSNNVQKLACGKYRYKVSTESVDCEQERILISAWTKLGKFPLLVDHVGNMPGEPIDLTKAVGTATVFIRDAELIADVDVTDPEVKARVEAGELPMASVGFSRLETEQTKSGGVITTKAELREVSLVAQGCNYDAMRLKAAQVAPVVLARIEASNADMIATLVRLEASNASMSEVVRTLSETLLNFSTFNQDVVASLARLETSDAYTSELVRTLSETLSIFIQNLQSQPSIHASVAPVQLAAPAEFPVTKAPPTPPNITREQLLSAVKTALNQAVRDAVKQHTGRLD